MNGDLPYQKLYFMTMIKLEKVSISTALPLEGTCPASRSRLSSGGRRALHGPIMHQPAKFQQNRQCTAELLMIQQFPQIVFFWRHDEP